MKYNFQSRIKKIIKSEQVPNKTTYSLRTANSFKIPTKCNDLFQLYEV